MSDAFLTRKMINIKQKFRNLLKAIWRFTRDILTARQGLALRRGEHGLRRLAPMSGWGELAWSAFLLLTAELNTPIRAP